MASAELGYRESEIYKKHTVQKIVSVKFDKNQNAEIFGESMLWQILQINANDLKRQSETRKMYKEYADRVISRVNQLSEIRSSKKDEPE